MNQTVTDMFELFAATADQMKLEDREPQQDTKKYEMMLSKLDKVIEQNKTIAEAMVGVVDMINSHAKEKSPEEPRNAIRGEPLQKPVDEIVQKFQRPSPQPWQPKAEPMQLITPAPFQQAAPQPAWGQKAPQIMPEMDTSFGIHGGHDLEDPPVPSEFEMGMPPMTPVSSPDFDFPEDPLAIDEKPKKKGIFGIFKK
jgi:hypothetical protein